MTPFCRIPLDVRGCEANHRKIFLEMPDEQFREQFGGRIPRHEEKLQWIDRAVRELNPESLFRNDRYLVGLYRRPPFIHLDIHRHDGGTCKEWRDFQQIKNELVGPEHEAVELFPAESRLIDCSNQYHLWVCEDPRVRFPLGWPKRVAPQEYLAADRKRQGAVAAGWQPLTDGVGWICSTPSCSVRIA